MGTSRDRDERRVALLFSDIEGSTRLARQLGDVWAETLGRHRDILRAAFASHGGEEVGREGDSFFVMFTSCRAAVEAAIDAHRGLATATWPPGGEIRVRVGVHVGAVSVFDSDPVGVDIHEAARIMSAAHGGQTIVSDDVAREIGHELPEGVFVRDLGPYRFKDFDEPRRVFQVAHGELVTDFPPLRALPAQNHNLPGTASSFVGRQAELVELRDAFASHRVVTVVGAGGCGKTRLAVETGFTMANQFPDGVWLVELGEVADPNGVTTALAEVLPVAFPLDTDAPVGMAGVVDAMSLRHLLIVLDNCEHLLAACRDVVRSLTTSCPEVRILATSREPLGVPGELRWRLPSLPTPPRDFDGTVDDLIGFDAVRLFLDRVALAAPDFEPTDGVAIARLCERLDGIPLALELAAANVAIANPDEILGRLERGGTSLGRDVGRPSRQQTLSAVIEWSYRLLTDQERVLLRRVCVFGAPFTLPAAEQVAGDDDLGREEVVGALSGLVAKSLVSLDRRTGGARYVVLETVRDYGLARLVDAGEAGDVVSRHSQWFGELAADTARRRPGIARVHCITEPPSADLTSVQALRATLERRAVHVVVVPTVPRDSLGRVRRLDLLPNSEVPWLAEQLREWRVVGAPLDVRGGSYAQFSVEIAVEPTGGVPWATVERASTEALHRAFDPIIGGPTGGGWPFGASVIPEEVAGIVGSIPGVATTHDVRLIATDALTDAQPDLGPEIPKVRAERHQLVFLAACWVRRVSDVVATAPTRFSATELTIAAKSVLRASSEAPVMIIGRRRGVRLLGGDGLWSSRADVIGSRLLSPTDALALTRAQVDALLLLMGRGVAHVELTVMDGCLEVQTPLGRATFSSPRVPIPRWCADLDPYSIESATSVRLTRDSLADAAADVRGLLDDGRVRVRLFRRTGSLALLAGRPGDEPSAVKHLDALVVSEGTSRGDEAFAVDVDALQGAVRSMPDGDVILDIASGLNGFVAIRHPDDPRIVHRISLAT